jgi:hypothetical protein
MQTTHDRATVAMHAGVTSHINTAIGHSSVTQSIEQAIHDTTSSAPAQSPVGSMLPGSIADVVAAATQVFDRIGASGDPGSSQAPGLGFDLHAPTGADMLSQALGSLSLSVSPAASGSTSSGSSGQPAGMTVLPGYDDGAFWAGDEVTSAGTAPVPIRVNNDGEVVSKGSGNASSDFPSFAGFGSLLGTGGLSGPTRDAMQQALHEDDVNSGRTSDDGSKGSNNAGGTSTAGNGSAGGRGLRHGRQHGGRKFDERQRRWFQPAERRQPAGRHEHRQWLRRQPVGRKSR